jgi:hypothetical protein
VRLLPSPEGTAETSVAPMDVRKRRMPSSAALL